jgi:uncharacterized membrane protein
MNDDYVPPAFRHRSDPPPSQPPPGHRPPPPPSMNPISRIEFERLFGGRVFAWMGGLAVLLGVVFFLRSAVDSSWFTEEVRTLMGAVGSFLLLVFGVWLHERRGHLEVARALVAAAIPGLFATTVVATQTYDLISPVIGLEAAALIGVVGVFLAVRWSSMLVGSVGMLGALAAPMLTGTTSEGGSIAFVAMALSASVGILLWQRWNWLSLGAFAVSAPQLADWVWTNKTEESTLLILAVLVGFWVLYAAAAFGYELRKREEEKLPAASWLLLLASSTLILGLGGYVLDRVDDQVGLNAWIFGFAGAHLLLGEIARRFGVHREVGSLLTGGGIGLASFGVAHAFDGPSVVAAWSALAAALAFVATRADATPSATLSNAERLWVLSLVFLGLGIAHVLFVEAPPAAIAQGVDDLGSSLVAIACCGAASVACWYFGRELEPTTATVVGFIGSASFVYLGSVAIIDAIGVSDAGNVGEVGQAWMSAFWAATGLGAIVFGMVRRAPNIRLGGLALLAVTIVKVWTYDLSELEDIARAISFIGLGLLLLAGAFAYQRFKPSKEEEAEEAFEEEFA